MADSQFGVNCQYRDEDTKTISACNGCSEVVGHTTSIHEKMLPAQKTVPSKEIQQRT